MYSIISGLIHIGVKQDDKQDIVLQKQSLVYQAILMSIGGIIWGLLALLNNWVVQSIIPFGYTILSFINLTYFSISKKFTTVKIFQTLISLFLPFLFQLSLGGFIASGGVILWSFLSLAVAVTYSSRRYIVAWTILYIILIITAGYLNSYFEQVLPDNTLRIHSVLFFVLNISVISIIVMLLINFIYSQKNNAIELLQSTQQQLVQSEKLASLGALTAGIAHEIKNPLNFVNNFSELSNDLVDEFLETNNEEERKEIAEDLKLNLKKINEHGKRADSIVKNMLQHSRSGSAEKQLTDINHICEEYLNLAYHGMRANHQGFNCSMEKNLEKDLPLVNCVAQDISRVILNLINNAFDELKNKSDGVLTITTQKSNNKVLIKIKDNGRGIPTHIKEKIFEPFFTTKPAGQGTGLGLSLSFDIVKAHGGKIEVNSEEGEGSEFIIQLPVG